MFSFFRRKKTAEPAPETAAPAAAPEVQAPITADELEAQALAAAPEDAGAPSTPAAIETEAAGAAPASAEAVFAQDSGNFPEPPGVSSEMRDGGQGDHDRITPRDRPAAAVASGKPPRCWP